MDDQERQHKSVRSIPSEGPMVRPRRTRPRMGWRALAYTASGGLWNPGPSEKEQRHRDRESQIATQLRGKHVTAFFCLKGGVSKTSTTAATSVALADLRPDPVFAIDANPDAGDLAERLVGRQLAGITALSRNVDRIDSLEDLSQFTVTAGRLTVLPGEPNPVLGDSLSSDDFERILAVIQRYYSYVQVDCGTGVTHPLMRGILKYATTVVVPAAWSVTGARRAAETIDWLEDNGFEHLAKTSICVLTAKDIVSRSVDKGAVLEHLGKAADLIVVPADPHMADGGTFDWELLRPHTQEAFLDIAEAITRRFDRPHHEIAAEPEPILGGALADERGPRPGSDRQPASQDAYARSERTRRGPDRHAGAGQGGSTAVPAPSPDSDRSRQQA
ncbi:MinD/ParA family ATP-binding protein [Piscicoccus intestinalis]|uniref:MinD/ParA family ATP-binding protein n=1 Tax=Piscicoccus intestinalis TaxID=746033 RepID=UPI001FDF663A|nr:MinD/ParA family protein [Piscicoccus intestinalis]